MKAKEVHKLTDEDLGMEVVSVRRKLFELRTQAVTEKIQDTSQFRKIRQDLARLLTERSTRQTSAAATQEGS